MSVWNPVKALANLYEWNAQRVAGRQLEEILIRLEEVIEADERIEAEVDLKHLLAKNRHAEELYRIQMLMEHELRQHAIRNYFREPGPDDVMGERLSVSLAVSRNCA